MRWNSAPTLQNSQPSYSLPTSFSPPSAGTASTAGCALALATSSTDATRSTLPVVAAQDSCRRLSGSASAPRSISPSSHTSGKKTQQSPPQSPQCRSRGMSPLCTPVPHSRCGDEGHDFWTPRTPPQPVPPAGMLKSDDEPWSGRRPKTFGNSLDGTGTSSRQLSTGGRRRSSAKDAAGPRDSPTCQRTSACVQSPEDQPSARCRRSSTRDAAGPRDSPMCPRTSACAQSPEDQSSARRRLSSAGSSPHGNSLTTLATTTPKSRKECAGTMSFGIPVPVRSISGRVGQQDPSWKGSSIQSAAAAPLNSTTSDDANGNGGPLSARSFSVPNTVAGSASAVVRYVTLPRQTRANEGE